MNQPCSKCRKEVVPATKFTCLDKVWHKSCFNCNVCGLRLDMKTYKGYEKVPYCNTHYPTVRHTVVADTPENIRLAKQSRQQSNLMYNPPSAESKYRVIGDDAELKERRIQQQMAKTKTKPPKSALQQPIHTVKNFVQEPEPAPPGQASSQDQTKYRAVYDYVAADDDEVSFCEGDVIDCVEVIDDGWMTGRVTQTGEHGMLPSNYIELM